MTNNLNLGQIASLGQIGLSFLACVGYAYAGDYRKAIYWGAATVITGSVTL